MAGDSQAPFSQSVRTKIREIYEYRCVICLTWLSTTQCAHVLDAEPRISGLTTQSNLAFYLNVIKGMHQIMACVPKLPLPSLPIPVLGFLEQYVSSTNQKPLHEVFDLLVDALEGKEVELPDLKDIIPYIGLFTLVTLNPTGAAGDTINTPHLPSLSIRRWHQIRRGSC
ncbi:hypothetical protein JOM56_000397 [Amanita muscaria]